MGAPSPIDIARHGAISWYAHHLFSYGAAHQQRWRYPLWLWLFIEFVRGFSYFVGNVEHGCEWVITYAVVYQFSDAESCCPKCQHHTCRRWPARLNIESCSQPSHLIISLDPYACFTRSA